MANPLRNGLGLFLLLAVASAATAEKPVDLGTFAIDKIELKRDYHGKLGAHLCETLFLVQDQKRFILELSCERERYMRSTRFVPADQVRITGSLKGGRISAKRGDVVRL